MRLIFSMLALCAATACCESRKPETVAISTTTTSTTAMTPPQSASWATAITKPGLMCAAYRVVVQGWTKEKAIQEMREGDFGFHEIWQNLVNYMNDLDVVSIKKQVEEGTKEE